MSAQSLTQPEIKKASPFRDLTGETFNRLTVVKRLENSKSRKARWLCNCVCGKTTVTITQELKSGRTKSCGCYNADRSRNQRLNAKGKEFIHGVGVNDGSGSTAELRSYQVWMVMLGRCYSKASLNRAPSYLQCTVDPDWHYYSVFAEWMDSQGDTRGLDLDKDLLIPGNKQYGPDACVFISRQINQLLQGDKIKKGRNLPCGVKPTDKSDNFSSQIKVRGKPTHLGVYANIADARATYLLALACNFAAESKFQNNPRVKAALINHAHLTMAKI